MYTIFCRHLKVFTLAYPPLFKNIRKRWETKKTIWLTGQFSFFFFCLRKTKHWHHWKKKSSFFSPNIIQWQQYHLVFASKVQWHTPGNCKCCSPVRLVIILLSNLKKKELLLLLNNSVASCTVFILEIIYKFLPIFLDLEYNLENLKNGRQKLSLSFFFFFFFFQVSLMLIKTFHISPPLSPSSFLNIAEGVGWLNHSTVVVQFWVSG